MVIVTVDLSGVRRPGVSQEVTTVLTGNYLISINKKFAEPFLPPHQAFIYSKIMSLSFPWICRIF